MTPSQKLARARNCFDAYCHDHFPEETLPLRDSVFICEGFYRGRRFRTAQVSGVWFAEEDQLKIHSLDGVCVASWTAEEMLQQLERLAPSTLPMHTLERPARVTQPGVSVAGLQRAA